MKEVRNTVEGVKFIIAMMVRACCGMALRKAEEIETKRRRTR